MPLDLLLRKTIVFSLHVKLSAPDFNIGSSDSSAPFRTINNIQPTEPSCPLVIQLSGPLSVNLHTQTDLNRKIKVKSCSTVLENTSSCRFKGVISKKVPIFAAQNLAHFTNTLLAAKAIVYNGVFAVLVLNEVVIFELSILQVNDAVHGHIKSLQVVSQFGYCDQPTNTSSVKYLHFQHKRTSGSGSTSCLSGLWYCNEGFDFLTKNIHIRTREIRDKGVNRKSTFIRLINSIFNIIRNSLNEVSKLSSSLKNKCENKEYKNFVLKYYLNLKMNIGNYKICLNRKN
ncbi:hypothetical protein BpHYR1_002828 [Brachionus plicatilis]|uniref:Uncharacterized protein n=1 Tax=Brachionus plicatilis TaxID=10195 RepID=A0A3M7SRM4_BRAPC|nr:hypothetical protein BpHYR1_002828 [Brachionus plicatilis]